MTEQIVVLNSQNGTRIKENEMGFYFSMSPALSFEGKTKDNLFCAVLQYTAETNAWLIPVYVQFDYVTDSIAGEIIAYDEPDRFEKSVGRYLYVEDLDDLLGQLNDYFAQLFGGGVYAAPSFVKKGGRGKDSEKITLNASGTVFKGFSEQMLTILGYEQPRKTWVLQRGGTWPSEFNAKIPTTVDVYITSDVTVPSVSIPPFGVFSTLLSFSALTSGLNPNGLEEERVRLLNWLPLAKVVIPSIQLLFRYQVTGDVVKTTRRAVSDNFVVVLCLKYRLRLSF